MGFTACLEQANGVGGALALGHSVGNTTQAPGGCFGRKHILTYILHIPYMHLGVTRHKGIGLIWERIHTHIYSVHTPCLTEYRVQ